MYQINELIKLILEQEFSTKENKPIEFKIHERSPRSGDDLERGWVIHLIEAFVDGQEAGYIKISYIPKENFEKEYPTIVHYVDKISGRSLYPGKEYGYKRYWSDHLNELPLSGQVRALAHIIDINMFSTIKNNKQPEDMTTQELLQYKKELLVSIQKKYNNEFEKFKEFQVDKPLVDYINVEPKFQRQRIGAALYEKAAKWLAKRGLKLYASGIQSNKAMKAWDWLRANKGANIGTEQYENRTRTFLSYL